MDDPIERRMQSKGTILRLKVDGPSITNILYMILISSKVTHNGEVYMFYFHEVIKGNKPVLRMANVKPEPIAPPVTPPKSRNQSTTSTGRNSSEMT